MTQKLPPSASVRTEVDGARLCAPAATRNVEALSELIQRHAPRAGNALEIASGTGQHVTAFARVCPGLIWQPTEIDAKCRKSIDAYRRDALTNTILPARQLDASLPGWHASYLDTSLVVTVNLLHLISEPAARYVIDGAVGCLAEGGTFVVYGPFMRDGHLTSNGDARFHAQLSGADPTIGYKNDTDVCDWLQSAGASQVETEEMPANNLAFIARH